MKNYKRLTFKKSENASNASYDELLNRLVELEDKIENGTLVEVELPCTEEEFKYICKYYENGLCHLGGELFGAPPQPCHRINDFENCMGSKPAKREVEVDCEEIAKNLTKLGYQKIVWHDVKKELPDGNWYILGYDYYGQTYAVVSWDGTDWSDDNGMCYNVDYWAELPEIEVEK